MRKIFIVLMLASLSATASQQPFSRGVNLTGWFQTSSVRQINFAQFTKQDFINIQSMGCDVIRLPINLHRMTTGTSENLIDPLFFYFLDQVIDWAEELNIYLILDNHATETSVFTDPNLESVLKSVWTQISERYKNRSQYIIYEIINEPHDISDAAWNGIQTNVLAVIRSIDPIHTIIVTPAGWGSYNNLKYMPVYNDDNLIYSFHFYDPFLFTHQGASWTDPSMVSLAGVPFPYDAGRMPACPAELKGTWVESSLNSGYRTDGTEKKVKELIDIAIKFGHDRNVPVFCGEFGVYMANSDSEDRLRWYGLVPPYLSENNVPWTMWDYVGGFGLFNKGSNNMFDYDVNTALVSAMGLTPPPQKEFMQKPDSVGFDIYTDYFAHSIFNASWSSSGTIDFYNEDSVIGTFCILMSDVDQYNDTGFSFRPVKDLSLLVQKEYAIDLWLKSDYSDMQVDIRFIDTKTDDPEDHPWRMRTTIDNSTANWDGTWNHLQIPLQDFEEGGSWDNEWFDPQGDFDWTQVDRLEIVAEHHDFKDKALYIDNVRIVDPSVVQVDDRRSTVCDFHLGQNYPNPFNGSTQIAYQLGKESEIRLEIYNTQGQRIRTLINTRQTAGQHTAAWDGLMDDSITASSGVYFYRLQTEDGFIIQKMTFVK